MMNVDEIVEAISKMEWDDLISIGSASQDRMKYLNRLELKKFKQGDHVKVRDTEGNYHDGMVWKVTSTKVRVDIGHGKPLVISPHLLTKWMQEAKVK